MSSMSLFARDARLTKTFDGSVVEQGAIDDLLHLIRSAATSFNFQPGRYLVASSARARARIARSLEGGYEANTSKVVNASHVIVFCSLTSISEAYLNHLARRQRADGAFRDEAAEANWRAVADFGRRLHDCERRDLRHWLEKQVYLVMGTALMGAARLGLDVCPMEGFHAHKLDAEFGLHEREVSSVLLLAVGRRSREDYVLGRTKSRLGADEIFTWLD